MIFKRMREQILDKAIRGQLVPQLQEEGVVDKIGNAPSEVPFDIPSSWKWVQMYSIGKTSTGTTPPTSNSDYYGHDIPFVKPGDIVKNSITYRTDGLSNKSRDVARILPKDSVLMVCIGGSIGKTAMCEREISFNQQINAIICNINYLHPKYMLYAFMSVYFQDEVWRAATGTTTPILKKSRWENLWIPLPPLAEQRRIASKIESLFGEIDCAEKAYEELQSLANVLRGQILQKAIQGKLVPQLPEDGVVEQIGHAPEEVPFDIPDSWKWYTLGNLIEYGNCKQVAGKDITSSTWVLDLEDIEKNTGKIIEKKRNVKSTSNKNVFEEGYVLYSKLRPYLNKVVIADETGVCTTEIIPLNVKTAKVPLLPHYLQFCLMSPSFLNYANRCSYGVKMPRLGTNDAKAAYIPVPPLAEQRRIVAKVDTMLEQIDLMTK